MAAWRFLATGYESGAFNMAVDETLLQGISGGGGEPVFRVFGWNPPALSLGYGQEARKEVDLEKCSRAGIDIVRRLTGGRAVLHWKELTYSAIWPEDDPVLGGNISETSRLIGRCLVEGLRLFGVEAVLEKPASRSVRPRGPSATAPCFSSLSRWEVKCKGRKLIGSAQRRVSRAILQHGSLLIGEQHKKLLDLLPPAAESMRDILARELDRGSIHLEACTSRKIDFDELSDCMARGFSRCLEVEMRPSALGLEERQRVAELVDEKYGNPAWNRAVDPVREAVDPVAAMS
jgi:lipoate-protein ligase A